MVNMPRNVKAFRWVTGTVLILTILLGVGGLAWYIPTHGVHPLEPITCVFLVYLIAWTVSSGYHRYFAHKTFSCHPALKIFFLIVGAASLEQSALVWASDHRFHHRYVDSDRDPYNIQKGFWWAHWGWLFAPDPPSRAKLLESVPDLAKDKWVLWQHRYWVLLSLPWIFGVPLLLGFLIDRPLGMLLWAGVLRVLITHHSTFLVNSAAHYFGTQPYSDDSSARDVWWLLPFLCGENYHNYHHRFQADYRNGVKWYHYDPSKWLLYLLSRVRLVSQLKRASPAMILKARLEMDLKRMEKKLKPIAPAEKWIPFYERLSSMRQALLDTAELYAKARNNYRDFKKNVTDRSRESLLSARQTLRDRKAALRAMLRQWQEEMRLSCLVVSRSISR